MASSTPSKALEVMNAIFQIAVDQNASDVHLVAGKPPLLRVFGIIKPVEGAKVLSADEVKELIYSILSPEQISRFENQKELDSAHQIASGKRFRVNLHWEKGDASLAARTIPNEIPTMDSLGLPAVVQKMADFPHGLVVVTGPTGSGKSTTLASMIEHINQSEPVNIITLEDPIEFLFESKQAVVRQRQFDQDFLSFSDALKHILRQDPDVVMVGEMRDPETIATTLTIAETGHLVFATLHTNSAAQTIDRIIDAMPHEQQNQVRSQLALTLRAVVSQQLMPKVGGGRIAAREILVNNSAVANLIRENQIAQIRNVLQTTAAEGMTTLIQDLNRLLKAGLIEREEAVRYVVGNEKLSIDEAPAEAKKNGWF
jgi:twitching motility protein PilT